MTKSVVNDWVVELGWDDTKFNAGIKRAEKRLADLEKRMKAVGAPSPTAPSTPRQRPSSPFSLDSAAQLKMSQGIDSVVRRAGRGLSETSREFQEINNRANKLKANISQINSKTSLQNLRNELVKLRETTNRYTASARKAQSAMNAQKFAAKGLQDSLRNLARSYVSVYAGLEIGRSFFTTGAEFDSLQAALLAASGNTQQAAQDWQFVKKTALDLGVRLSEVADGYRLIGTAGRFSALTSEQTNEAFLSAAEAARAFGLKAEQSGRVFRAFSQIISKGKVTMEELRGQLGDSLPSALPIAANAMGVTTAELEKMVEAGISAEEFIPKFSRELRKSVRDSGALAASLNSITAAQQRLSSAIQLNTVESFNTGGKSGVVFFFNELTKSTKNLEPVFRMLGRLVAVLGGGIATLVSIMTSVSQPVIGLADAFGEVLGGLFNVTDASKAWEKSLEGVRQTFDFIKNVLMIIPGVLELIFDSGKEVAKLKDINLFDKIATHGGLIADGVMSALNVSREKVPLSSTVNSGNTLSVTIQGADLSNKDSIKTAMSDWWQDTMRIAN